MYVFLLNRKRMNSAIASMLTSTMIERNENLKYPDTAAKKHSEFADSPQGVSASAIGFWFWRLWQVRNLRSVHLSSHGNAANRRGLAL
jgi:hypothetical protein